MANSWAATSLPASPPGRNEYLLKSVIHDWDDKHSLTILKNCRTAMNAGSKLLLSEPILPKEAGFSPFVGSDLNMLTLTRRAGAHQGFRDLLARAGLHLARIFVTTTGATFMEALPNRRLRTGLAEMLAKPIAERASPPDSCSAWTRGGRS